MTTSARTPTHPTEESTLSEQHDLERLVAEAAVRDLTARFADTGTRNDRDGFRTLWADGARWRIGEHVDATGIDEIMETLTQLRDGRDFFVQFATQGPITVTGDEAISSTLCHEAARGPGENYYRNHCRTEDHLVRTASGEWRFAERTYSYIWLDTSPFGGDAFPIS